MERWADFDVVTLDALRATLEEFGVVEPADETALREVADAFAEPPGRRRRRRRVGWSCGRPALVTGVLTNASSRALGRVERANPADGPLSVGRRRAPVQAAPERVPAGGRRDRAPGRPDRLRDGATAGTPPARGRSGFGWPGFGRARQRACRPSARPSPSWRRGRRSCRSSPKADTACQVSLPPSAQGGNT